MKRRARPRRASVLAHAVPLLVAVALSLGAGACVGQTPDPQVAPQADADVAPEALEAPDYKALEGLPVLRIEISGNARTKEYVILRELQTGVGDSLNLATMQKDRTRLTRLSAFSRVEIVPRAEGDGVVYAIAVDETAQIIPALLPGYSEENGWYIGPMVSTTNLLGRAVMASALAQWGGVTNYSFNIDSPWLSVADRQLSLSAGTSYKEREDKIRESQEISSATGIRTAFYPERRRIFSLGLGFQLLRTMSDKSGVTLSPSNSDHLYQLEVLLRANSVEDPLDPHSGWVAGVQEKRTGGALGGDGDSWRTQVDVARYQPLSARGVLAIGGVFASQTGVVGEDIPTYLQYNLGGTNSVRGYSRTELGKELYGKNQILGTVEYSHLFMSPRQIQLFGLPFLKFRVGMNLVGFVDFGVAWTDPDELNTDRSRIGYGAGLHLMVPGIDRIRLDVGLSQDGDVEFHLGTRAKFDAWR